MIFEMIFTLIIICLVLVVIYWGAKKEIRYLNYKEPLGRISYICMNMVTVGIITVAPSIVNSRMILYGDMPWDYVFLACLMGFVGCLFLFLSGMRRITDLGTPNPWAYPIAMVIICGIALFLLPAIADLTTYAHWGLALTPGAKKGKDTVSVEEETSNSAEENSTFNEESDIEKIEPEKSPKKAL